jgi:gliding motility-associated-like protein/uncharacterized repeat protein (TIGR01451 family)
MLNSLRPDIGSFCRNIYCLFLLVLVCFSSELKADGSRELYPAGATGNRAFLYCNTNSSWTDTWPFKTAGTHYAYLKIGEVIAAASSAQGYDSGTIIITSPDGTTYTSSNSVTIGRIINRNAEIAGPNNGVGAAANRYTPYEKQANIEGIWRVDFIPPTGLTGTADFAVPDVSATANWTQGTLQNGTADVIAAWDVSVRSGTNWISGRVYTNVLNLVVKDSFTEGKSYYAVHYVLTKDGRAYKIRTNGNNGVGFTFFSNSNGFAINSIPTYKSLNFSERASIIPFTHDPRIPDEGNNVTHKIFYTKPSPDLPASSVIYISGSISSTWLKNTAVLPKITDLVVVGKEGTIGQAGNKGAFINFKSTTGGTYKITIPVIAPGTDRVIIGVAAVGDNSVFWDGKDGSGNFVPAGTTISQLKTKLQSAEVHFPYIDMEINPRGLIIELTDNTTGYNLQTTSTDEGVYSNKVYWDDSDISGAGVGESSNPFKNSSGLSSITNGHIWGSYNSNSGSGNSGTGGSSFGNNKSMDTWTYIQGSEESQPMALEIKSADLMVQNIVPIVNTYFTDHNIIYKIRVKNDGPSDISGATFDFKAPPGYNITSVVPAVISGTASVNSPVVSGSTYQSKLTMNNQVVIEFTVSGTVVAPLLNQIFTIEASILRPSDVTDPDATDPNSTTPTDPHLECYNGTGVKDCNNIKYNTIDPQELCLGADIRPIEYLLSIGGTLSRIIGSVPAVLNNIYTDPTKTSRVSGKVNAAGIYNFTLGTLNSEKETTTAIIKVNPLPAIVSQPVATPVCEGTDAVFSVTSDGTDTYQWQYEEGGVWKNFANAGSISGATTTTLKISSIPLTDHGKKVKVIITSAFGCSIVSTEIKLVVNARPVDTNFILGSKYICEGGTVQLRSSVSGAVGYQWFYNGAVIPGANQRFYNAANAGRYSVAISNALGCLGVKSDELEVVLVAFPAIPNITHGPLTVCIGSSVILKSDPASTYQWYLGDDAINGATSQEYTAATSGSYSVVITNIGGCAESSARIPIVISPLPNQPGITGTAVICAGDVAVLTSDAAAGYQWYFNGTAIPSATGRTYDAKLAGKYTVIVTNTNGCFSPVSSEFELTVNTLPNQPGITGMAVICAGDVAVLTSDAAAGYQWYFNGTAIPSATGRTYDAKIAGKYTVIVTNTNGCFSQVSSEFELTVNTLPNQPGITGTAVICAGDVAVLTSDAAAGYQWYFNGTVIPSAKGRTYNAKLAGKYTVIVTNTNGCFSPVSSKFELTVNTLPNQPGITGTAVICAGDVAVLTSDASTGNQWYLNGIAISGATGKRYEAKISGKYTVVVTDALPCSSLVSNEIEVTVNPLPATPTVSAGVAPTTFCIGGSVTLTSSSATGNQWYKDGSILTGETGQTYVANASGDYTIVVTNTTTGCPSAASLALKVTVNPLPATPTVSAGVAPTIFCAGGSVTLTSSSGTGNQWYKDGSILTGETGQTYIANASGDYTVVVTNATTLCPSAASAALKVTVNPLPSTPTVSAGGAPTTFCAGGSVTLTSSSATGNQWFKGSQAIPGAINATYITSEAGVYTVRVTNASNCISASADVNVIVNELPIVPTIIVNANDLTFCEGGSVTLTSSSDTGNQWYKNGQEIPGASNKTYTTTEAGNYTVKVTNASGCYSLSSTATVMVNRLPAAPTIIVNANDLTFCEGGSVTLTSSAAAGNQWYKDGEVIPGATGKTYTTSIGAQYMLIVTNTNGCSSAPAQPVQATVVAYPVKPNISPAGTTTFCEGGFVTLTSNAANGNQWYKNGTLIPGATNQTFDVSEIGNYTVKVTNATGCASAISALTNVTVNQVPKGYNDQINSLNCTQSSFSYNLQTNVNDIAKGGNAVPALFTWTASSSIVTGVSNGSGKTINASLINTSAVAQSIAYTVTPVAETGGCAGQPFVITVQVPVCIAISINKVADKATVSAVGDKLTYTITVRNDGNANHNQVKVTDAMFGGRLNQPQGDNGNGILEKGEAWIYKQSYTITQSDLDNNGWPVIGTGKIINTANVSSLEEILPKTVNAEVNIQNNPSLTLVKTGKMDRGFKTITYTFKITNNGNVTLYNLALTDPKFTTPITLKQTTLIPGASTTETGIYTITEPEKVAGITTNTATIVGFTKPGIKVTDVSGTTEQNDEPTIIDITRYPVAIDDYASTKAEEEVAVPIVNNDRPALFPLNFATVDVKTQPSNGKIVVGKDGKVTYKPNKGFFGTERFTYKIADDNGLSSNIAEVRIDVAPPPLDIPNTFTPNGDGKNDTFVIVGMENYEMVSIFVYNRWGDEVYRNNNYKNEWDGNGLNEGTYFYVLKLKKGKTEETRRSWVLIKR